jgi:signal transduction histidine kinase
MPNEKVMPAVKTKLRILVLEDNLQDRTLIRSQLENENIDCEMFFTGGRRDFEAALAQGVFNLILSDYSLPQFDGLSALRLVREKEPDLPFILISGTLGEEQAVECLKLGATDYILKHRLARLGSAIRRALEEAEVRARQRRADETMRELSRRLLRLQDEERRRVARELHDSVAQNLVALVLNLSAAGRLIPATESKVKLLLSDCATLADATTQALRTVSYLLHPPVLDSLGLPGALHDFVAGFGRRSGIKVALKVPKKFGRLPVEIETALYRVVQESLTNIHRHSGSASANIGLRRGKDTIILEIQDFGRGIPSETLRLPRAPGSIGVGIAGMRERLHLLQGRLEIESTPAGTRVRAVVPNRVTT